MKNTITITRKTEREIISTLKEDAKKALWKKRLLADLHQFSGLDFEKPFTACEISGAFTLAKLENEMKPEGRYLLGFFRFDGWKWLTIWGGRPELLPCQFCSNIWTKSDFQDYRKNPEALALFIYQPGLVCREYRETPAFIKEAKAKQERSNNAARRAERLRALKREKDAKRYNENGGRVHSVKSAEMIRAEVLRQFHESAASVKAAADLKSVSLWEWRWLLEALEEFINYASRPEGSAKKYEMLAGRVDHYFREWLEKMAG